MLVGPYNLVIHNESYKFINWLGLVINLIRPLYLPQCLQMECIVTSLHYWHTLILALVCRVGVNSAPELDFLANSKSNSGIGIELELALPSPGGIGIELELPSFELELESELRSSELNSELPSWN